MSKTPVGAALHAHGEAVDHVEALYLQHEGEVTTEVEQAEAARDHSAVEALESVARYLLWLADQEAAVAKERKRLAVLATQHESRRAWAEHQAAALMAVVAPERNKTTVGTMKVRLRHTEAVVAQVDLDPRSLPVPWQRTVDAVPAVPETVAIDRKAVKADRGWHSGAPPVDAHAVEVAQDADGQTRWRHHHPKVMVEKNTFVTVV